MKKGAAIGIVETSSIAKGFEIAQRNRRRGDDQNRYHLIMTGAKAVGHGVEVCGPVRIGIERGRTVDEEDDVQINIYCLILVVCQIG